MLSETPSTKSKFELQNKSIAVFIFLKSLRGDVVGKDIKGWLSLNVSFFSLMACFHESNSGESSSAKAGGLLIICAPNS